MTTLEMIALPALQDNYIWLLQKPATPEVIVVDPGDAAPVLAYLQQHQKKLAAILVTHHHGDHTHGIAELCQHQAVPVYGACVSPQPHITHHLQDGDSVHIAALGLSFTAIAIPGHTLDHTAYYCPAMVFTGDTLFSAGCGRVFEGTMPQMWQSLQRLMALPDDTAIYCGHEYTLQNLAFAAAVEPDNQAIIQHTRLVEQLRAENKPSLPSNMGLEKQINPFLRVETPSIIAAVAKHHGRKLSDFAEIFAHLRHWKNNF